jgi:hypothetical protein
MLVARPGQAAGTARSSAGQLGSQAGRQLLGQRQLCLRLAISWLSAAAGTWHTMEAGRAGLLMLSPMLQLPAAWFHSLPAAAVLTAAAAGQILMCASCVLWALGML